MNIVQLINELASRAEAKISKTVSNKGAMTTRASILKQSSENVQKELEISISVRNMLVNKGK